MGRELTSLITALALATPAIAMPACKPGAAAQQLAKAPDMADATGQPRCGEAMPSNKPLVVEWPAADRAALESRASQGLVAVRYRGCQMEVLTNCTARGSYRYVGLTVKRESVSIRNADDLYANLPVGAARLEGKLQRSGQLNVDMHIVGRQEADAYMFSTADLTGRCEEATHVVTGLTTGAFTFYTGSSAEVGAGAAVGNVGVGASTASEHEMLSMDGEALQCQGATSSDLAPPAGCAALMRVEVVPVDRPPGARPADPATAGMTDTGSTMPPDEAAKKLKTWRIVLGSSYLLALGGGIGLIYGGAAVQGAAEKDLSSALAEANDGAGSAQRRDAIKKARTGSVLMIAGIGSAVVFGALGLYAQVKVQKLKKASVAFAPTPLRGGGGIAAEVRF